MRVVRGADRILSLSPVIPVVHVTRSADAPALAQALLDGGVAIMEITLRTRAALDAVTAVRRKVPEMTVGAGTIVKPNQAMDAKQAGAQFLVSPGCTPQIFEALQALDLPCLPGAMTPSEIMAAVSSGLNALKFFPAQQAGGLEMLKAFAGPFPDVVFCPTGGLGANDFTDYLALDNVACVGGSWLTPADALEHKDWPRITALAREAVNAALRNN